MPLHTIEKLDPSDTRPATIIDKLNELIDAFNNHWHVCGREGDSSHYPSFWGKDEPRNETNRQA